MFCPKCRADYPADWKACPKDATALLTSAQIGKYTIDGLLGVGGMGAVYKATNPDTRGRVAVKVMNPEVATAEQMRQRFQREAAAVAALRTAHVVKVYDFGEEANGTLYLVMEYLDGHPLRAEIQPEPQAMDLARVQMVMDGALRGLIAAHKAGIVHRDLKPENIYVADTDDGEVTKLLDFGIARVRTAGENLTRTGSLMGTAPYMAPEQIGAGGDIGPWSDVYAMGAILYEMLAGVPAFGGDTLTDVLARVLKGEVVPLDAVRPGLPAEVYALVARCLAPEAAERPQDAEMMRAAFASARLVPAGAAVPPPHRTRPDGPARADLGSAQTAAPAPALAPTSAVTPTTPPPASITAPPVSAPVLPVARPARWPLLLAGVAITGGAGFVGVRMLGAPAPAPAVAPPVDAAIVAVSIDAAPPVDAAPAPLVEGVEIAAGTYTIGEVKASVPDALPRREVTLAAFAIDRAEVTVGALRAALGPALPPQVATRLASEPATAPARFVDLPTAEAACRALGKRLPTEPEWEVAALTTPQDSTRARLRRTGTDEDLTAPATDCSAAGLCDMLGGLSEWTSTPWPKRPRLQVVRGASYRIVADGQLDSIHARVALPASTRENEVGFRCVTAAAAPSRARKD